MDKGLSDFYKGDGKEVLFTISVCGEVDDITNKTVTFFLYKNETDADSSALLNINCIPIDPLVGTTLLVLTKEDTDIIRKKYWYKVKVYDASGTPSTVMSDSIRCK